MVKENIILYFPYKEVGGVSILFLRLANELKNGSNVFLVDYYDGYMGKRVPEGVEFIDFEKVKKYPGNSIFVMQSALPWNISDIEKIPDDSKLFLWNLHPDNFYPYIFSELSTNKIKTRIARLLNPLSYFRIKKIKNFLQYLIKENAIAFMDSENLRQTNKYFPDIKIPKRLVPIITTGSNKYRKNRVEKVLRCYWIGRIADFKVYILEHLIKRLDSIKIEDYKIEFKVIGNGDHLDWLKKKAINTENMEIDFLGEVPFEKLETILENEVDIVFAMGTSALEGASYKIPTFILDYSYKPIEGIYKFKFIYEVKDFTLGRLIGKEMYEEKSSLKNQLEAIINNQEYISERCYEFWKDNFSPEAVNKKFINTITASSATVGEMNRLGFFKPDILSYLLKIIRVKFLQRNTLSGYKRL